MSIGSKIQWTEATWNPVTGCSRVSAGCDNCYAVRQTHRLEEMGQEKYAGLTSVNGAGKRHFNGVVRCHPDALDIPLKRRKPTLYFVNSMSDLFHDSVPFEFIDQVFAVMSVTYAHVPLPPKTVTPWHMYQILTKRPERMCEYLASRKLHRDTHGDLHPVIRAGRQLMRGQGVNLMNAAACLAWPLSNVWLGVSVESEYTNHLRVPYLRDIREKHAWHTFMSYEPALSHVHPDWFGIPEWVIIGGESGPNARPFDTRWALEVIEAGRQFETRVFIKQLGRRPIHNGKPLTLKHPKGGDIDEWPEELRVRELPAAFEGYRKLANA